MANNVCVIGDVDGLGWKWLPLKREHLAGKTNGKPIVKNGIIVDVSLLLVRHTFLYFYNLTVPKRFLIIL